MDNNYVISEELIAMVEFVKVSENEILKKGLTNCFDIMENMNKEIENLKKIIEKTENERDRILLASRSNYKREILKKRIKDLLKSEKSGF